MDDMGEMFYAIGAWICLRPLLMTLVGLMFIGIAFFHFKRSRWYLRPIAGTLTLLVGLLWLAAAGLEEHCRRWAEANVDSVPIRVDLVMVPSVILPAAGVAMLIWGVAFKAKKHMRSQPATAPYSEPVARSPQG